MRNVSMAAEKGSMEKFGTRKKTRERFLVSGLFIDGFHALRMLDFNDKPSPVPRDLDGEREVIRAELLARLEMVLATLNDLLVKELPEHETVAMIYAVLNPSRYSLSIASAGHLSPLVFEQYGGKAARRDILCGPMLGQRPGSLLQFEGTDPAARQQIRPRS